MSRLKDVVRCLRELRDALAPNVRIRGCVDRKDRTLRVTARWLDREVNFGVTVEAIEAMTLTPSQLVRLWAFDIGRMCGESIRSSVLRRRIEGV
jgi:hypothetical protein